MNSRDELAKALLSCLAQLRALLESAYEIAREERQALVRSDVEGLARSCKAQDEVLRRVTERDEHAAEIATRLAEVSGLDSENLDALALMKAAGSPYDELLRAELARIHVVAQKLKEEHEINRRLLENGLEIVASCLKALANDATPPAYSNTAAFVEPSLQVISLDRRA